MYERDGAFDDYMGIQYREGQQAYKIGNSTNPYSPDTEMGKAWQDGFAAEHKQNKSHCK